MSKVGLHLSYLFLKFSQTTSVVFFFAIYTYWIEVWNYDTQ